MKKSRGVISEKEKLSIQVTKIARTCRSLYELSTKLEAEKLEPYYRRGMLTGIWFGNMKLRLTTLGVGKQHLKELTKEQKRLDLLNRSGNSNQQELER